MSGFLRFTVFSARGLPKMDAVGSIDAYVIVFVGEESRQTQIVKNNQAPVFNQTFELAAKKEDELIVVVSDWDRFTKSEEVGSAKLKVSNFVNKTGRSWVALTGPEGEKGVGEVDVQVSFTVSDGDYSAIKPQNGKGTWDNGKGDKYLGDFKDGKKTGYGTYTWKDGTKYVGDFVDCKFEGYGVQTSPNGEVYEGEWHNDKRHGKGIQTWPDGDRYTGDYVEGKRSGKGTYTWASGRQYVGDYVNGKQEGKGVWSAQNGQRYEGDFKNDKRTGKGKWTWEDGSTYEGDFVDGRFEGKGISKDKDGKVTHAGQFKNDKPVK